LALIYGYRPVQEALRAGVGVKRLYVAHECGRKVSALADDARRGGVSVTVVSERELLQLCRSQRHQGVAAEVDRRAYTVEDLVGIASERGEKPFLVVSDHLEDPHNLGAVLRTAECAGCHGAVIPVRRASPVTGTVVRASAGATAHLPLAVVSNVAQALRRLKELGVWCVGLSGDAGETVYAADLTGPLALVVGAENRGVGHAVELACDFLVRIPLFGEVESLNASVAFGVAAFEALRQRRGL
jgi:23S rRNA (guanosine2251-2'-O)-methyltransferase